MAVRLHEVITDVLKSSEKPLSVREISDIIKKGQLWIRPSDGEVPDPTQISARVNNYPELFIREDGIVTLRSQINEKRIARLCWNDNGWVHPSGIKGKSTDKKSHERRFGYGHEEWLFDMGRIVNGFHYGFLEPIRKQQQAYSANSYDVWLYTINSETKKRYWVGEIFNVKVIEEKEAMKVSQTYLDEGWINDMEAQIRFSGANHKGLSNWKGIDLLNIKFRLSDVKFEKYFELPDSHPIHRISRYSFSYMKKDFDIVDANPKNAFTFIPPAKVGGSKGTKLTKKTFFREPKAVEISNLHRAISDNLVIYLRKIYGESNVSPEHNTLYGSNRIDIVVKDNKRIIFFEIKTYASIQTSIREAFGQIMEYAHWTNYKNADELIIITQVHKDYTDVRSYMPHLRETFNLPIFYQAFDLDSNLLTEKF